MLNPVEFRFDIPWAIFQLLPVALAITGLLVGGAWIIRIARGTGDESAHWRYRKH